MRILLLTCLLAITFVCGCARLAINRQANYRTIESNAISDETAARKIHEHALELLSNCQIADAEQCLHEALIEDVSFGPAHNTLGKLYYDQKKFYLAAWEFEYAIKTMPNRAEPHNNLGLVLESVEQLPDAIAEYQLAMEASRENPQYLGNYLRARYRETGFTEDIRLPLQELIVIDDRPSWVAWAKSVLSKNHPQIRAVSEFDSDILRSEIEEFDVGDTQILNEMPSNSLQPILNGPPVDSPSVTSGDTFGS